MGNTPNKAFDHAPIPEATNDPYDNTYGAKEAISNLPTAATVNAVVNEQPVPQKPAPDIKGEFL